MGGDPSKKGEASGKSKGKTQHQPGESHMPSHSLSTGVRMEDTQEREAGNINQNYSPSQFQHNIITTNNSLATWNGLLEPEEIGRVVGGEGAYMRGSHSGEKPKPVIGRAAEKQLISSCGFPSSSDDNRTPLVSTSSPILGIQQSAKCNVSPSSAPHRKGTGGAARSPEDGHHLDHPPDTINHPRTGEMRSNFLVTADEDYDQSFVTHISSDENEHLLPSNGGKEAEDNNGECHPHHHKKDGKTVDEKRKFSLRKNRKIDMANRTAPTASLSEQPSPATFPMPFPVIKDGENGNFWRSDSTSSRASPPPPPSKPFYLLFFAGVSRALVLLSIFSLVLVTCLWYHNRLSYLEREFGLQKERMEILADNILEAEKLLNRHADLVDPEEEEEEDDDAFHDRAIITGTRRDEEEVSFQRRSAIDQNENHENIAIGQRLRKMLGKVQRVKRRVDSHQQTSSSSSRTDNSYNVEFLNTKLKEDKDKSVGPYDKTAGSAGESGQTGPDDEWVWLTGYSRIPLPAIEEFCSRTKEYCPTIPGPQGPPGNPGKPGRLGEKGEPGLPGEAGHRGHQGFTGHPGLRGPKGEPGIPGLPGADGRDGLPGEPGLDGIPGRNGLDGVPGIDGIPGMDGRPGIPGRNGSDGIPGSVGPQGAPGLGGPRGLAGPRGPSGNPGVPGRDGIPGVQAWAVGNNTKQLLIPPSILGSDIAVRPLVVNEGENVRLWCSAAGVPRPVIKWKRKEGGVIPLGSWKTSAVDGPVLNLTRINREHMGEYSCIADNGVTPHKQRNFIVEVHFPPMIRIQNQMIGASISSKAMFDCYIEAFPPAVTYWERSDGRIIEASEKYHVGTRELGPYKVHMMLNVSRVSLTDMGRYHCVSKNELGTTKGDFTMYEVDPNLVTPPSKAGGKGVAIYGQVQPEHVDLDDICPSPPPCPDCPPRIETGKCRSGGFALLDMVGWEIYRLGNLTSPKATNRTQDCVLSAVGKPVFNRFSAPPAGCWMRESFLQSGLRVLEGEKYWVTKMEDTSHLFEYMNKTAFAKGPPTRNFTLPFPFKGNFHAVFNGSFYYVTESKEGRPKIVRLDLLTGLTKGDLELPYASFSAEKLYSSEFSWVDLNVDENGLWAVHSLVGSNNTAIVKIHADQEGMEILYGWNVTISHVYAGDMFVICGVLYAVDSTTERETKIRLALDLYRRTLLKVDLSFSNPFRHTTLVAYNPRTRELFTWDKGNQLIYPIKYTDIGYDIKEDNKERPNNDLFSFPNAGYPASA